jgi:hypothetical protein
MQTSPKKMYKQWWFVLFIAPFIVGGILLWIEQCQPDVSSKSGERLHKDSSFKGFRTGWLKHETAFELYRALEGFTLIQQKGIIKEYFLGKHVRWPARVEDVSILIGSGKERAYTLYLWDDELGEQIGIYVELGKPWKESVELLERGDLIYVTGRLARINHRSVYLENATIEAYP